MTNNKLKIIAVISMIIDHFGYYFNYLLSSEIYLICRIIGRLAMPIFVFLIIEGYFNTSNFNKYIKRLGMLAIVTQVIVIMLDFFANQNSYKIGWNANILFSFITLLLLLKLLEKTIESQKLKYKFSFVIYIAIIYILYNYIKFDYGVYILILGVGMYIIKKYIKNNYLYKIFISILIIVISLIMGKLQIFAIFSCIPIVFYNGNLGKKSNILRNTFYYIFPLQHFILYGVYVLLNNLLWN